MMFFTIFTKDTHISYLISKTLWPFKQDHDQDVRKSGSDFVWHHEFLVYHDKYADDQNYEEREVYIVVTSWTPSAAADSHHHNQYITEIPPQPCVHFIQHW